MSKSKATVGAQGYRPIPTKKRTSIGSSPLSRPTNKSKRRAYKKYRGQGR